jgi:hypothetical protein
MSKHSLGVKSIFIIFHSRFIGATNGLTEYSDTFEEIEGTDRDALQSFDRLLKRERDRTSMERGHLSVPGSAGHQSFPVSG